MSPSNHSSRPTSRQLGYLRSLARQTGTTFATPATRADARSEIARLRQLKRSGAPPSFSERSRHERLPTYATAPQPDEIDGFGSTARWRTTPVRDPLGR
jgi:hypothetical protein